jgi:hypothetical protein
MSWRKKNLKCTFVLKQSTNSLKGMKDQPLPERLLETQKNATEFAYQNMKVPADKALGFTVLDRNSKPFVIMNQEN